MQKDVTKENIIETIKQITGKTIKIESVKDGAKFSFGRKYCTLTIEDAIDYDRHTNNEEVCLCQLEDLSVRISQFLNIL